MATPGRAAALLLLPLLACIGGAAPAHGTAQARPVDGAVAMSPQAAARTPAASSAPSGQAAGTGVEATPDSGTEAATTSVRSTSKHQVSSTPAPSPTSSPTPTPAPTPTPTPAPTQSPSGPWLGILQTSAAEAPTERAAGVSYGHLELSWASYEPSPGVFDSTYAANQRSKLSQLRQAGLQVTLDAGLQYPPAWVFSLDSATRFVDQYGDTWHGSLSEDVPDAVFDSNVRNAEAAYIARIAADLGTGFDAVRAGGLLQDELRYPDASYNGHTNCYWGFDAHAQATSPVPGWIPGQADSTKASQFLAWYLQSIDGFESWLVGTYRSHFPTAWLQVLMPSWGLRPGDTTNAIASDLNGSTPPATWGTLEMGLDWANQVTVAQGDSRVMAYSTWLERGDDGTTPQTLGPAHYLVTLASPLGRPVAGENATATDSISTMQTVVQRVKSWGLVGLMWLDEPQLFGSGPVHLTDLTGAFFS